MFLSEGGFMADLVMHAKLHNRVYDLLPNNEVVLVGMNFDDTEVNAHAHRVEFDVTYLSLLDSVKERASPFDGIGASTIPSTTFLEPDGRVAARLLGLTDAREMPTLSGTI